MDIEKTKIVYELARTSKYIFGYLGRIATVRLFISCLQLTRLTAAACVWLVGDLGLLLGRITFKKIHKGNTKPLLKRNYM